MKNLLRAGAVALAMVLGAPAMAQADQYPDGNASSPCRHWALITPADGVVLTRLPKALWVGGAGNVNMIGVDAPAGATGTTWSGVPAGALLPARPRVVNATGTTATLIVACY